MPKRPSLRDRLAQQSEPQGREAVYGAGTPQTEDVDRIPSRDREPAAGQTWDESHRRVTFYCPQDVLEAIEAEMARSGRSKSRVIVDALSEHLEGVSGAT